MLCLVALFKLQISFMLVVFSSAIAILTRTAYCCCSCGFRVLFTADSNFVLAARQTEKFSNNDSCIHIERLLINMLEDGDYLISKS